MSIAVIADIVGSRALPDRQAGQKMLDAAISRVHADRPFATQPLHPTVGDEQQGLYPDLSRALASLLLLQLALPEGIQCRFGIGVGEVRAVSAANGDIPEGPGWWAARDAIEHVRSLEHRAAPQARTWIVVAEGEHDEMKTQASMANAYLLAKDDLVAQMNERTRRLVYGRCVGSKQSDLARAEGISQPAVSQALSSAGARAVVEGFRVLTASVGDPQ
ncbi:SatD family protein [Microbacterium sp. C7(2022)]|uniref:SatD family protein n=1 Tax=Microbacterium sp. C7(2022) TaxID=2992759 RepID=UPI00237B7B2B|nr:SatD family protein [Microbacterium sp. C7(2022)]MDE0545861.1 SatD family protein [Microbacterium sp. C7(2022)]